MADKLDALISAIIDLKIEQRLLDNRFGEISPIDNNLLPNMQQGSVVVITEDVKAALISIQELTIEMGKEFPFLLYGNNSICIHYNKFLLQFQFFLNI